jgi:hypothetical protein
MRYPKWSRMTVREETQFHYPGSPGSVRPGLVVEPAPCGAVPDWMRRRSSQRASDLEN